MTEVFEEGEKLFRCIVCGKIGKRKDNLLAHIETHLPPKPVTCLQCGKLFKTKNSLTSHVSRWHRQVQVELQVQDKCKQEEEEG